MLLPYSHAIFSFIICAVSLYILCTFIHVMIYSTFCFFLKYSGCKECNCICLYAIIEACMFIETNTCMALLLCDL